MNLVKLVEKFRSDDKCRRYLEKLRWPEGVCCPRCGGVVISRIHYRDQFDCDNCRYQFSVTSGTMMHDTKLPLWKWFLAVYMMVEAKKGVSANQLKRTLDVSYRTAWYLCHRIRKALETPDGLLAGVVEIDATYIGGEAETGPLRREGGKWKKPRSPVSDKALVLGALERGGTVRLKSQGKGGGETKKRVSGFVKANLSPDSTVYSDEGRALVAVLREYARSHATIEHKNDRWVEGDVHTNGIEGVWSLFKRSVVGSYHHISVKHLAAYLEEFEFRFNNRHNPFIFRDAMGLLVKADHLEYQQLVA